VEQHPAKQPPRLAGRRQAGRLGRRARKRAHLSQHRDFDYRSESDFTRRYEDRTYDLSKLRGLDLFMSYWDSAAIAHTIMSWQFDGAAPLAISIETRKTKGQTYSAVDGFFKQYEVIYVAVKALHDLAL
jgi:hypothetical protein